jgi:outer membrane protein assembly factor BamA
MATLTIQMDEKDVKRIDEIKQKMKAKTRPETIRNLMSIYDEKQKE